MFTFRKFIQKLELLNKKTKEEVPIDIAIDKKLELELCKKGPCEKLKKKNKYLPELYKQLFELSTRFNITIDAKYLGESKEKYADSCSFIKKYYQSNVNGFYWIQNICSKNPVKMYCKNKQKNTKGY